ncbi:hypothetical protein BDV19DRAFT_230739 [Aspergillus venezuelensis]
MGISWYIYLVLALIFRFSESRFSLTLLHLVSYIPLLLRSVLYHILIEGYYWIFYFVLMFTTEISMLFNWVLRFSFTVYLHLVWS